MTNQDTIPGNQTPAQPSPQLQAVPGYQTTSGQFTALFTVIALILGLLGFHYSPDQVEGWVQFANKLAVTIGPLLAVVPVLMTYVNSRGKIASNTLNANAAILAPATTGAVGGTLTEFRDPMEFAGLGKVGGILGGTSWKDPHRYENILQIAKAVGVPGAAQADAVNQQIHPADLITGILGMLHKKQS